MKGNSQNGSHPLAADWLKELPVTWTHLSADQWCGVGMHNGQLSWPINDEGQGHWALLANRRCAGWICCNEPVKMAVSSMIIVS